MSTRLVTMLLTLGLLGLGTASCEQKSRSPFAPRPQPSDGGQTGEGGEAGGPTGPIVSPGGGGEKCEEPPPIDTSDLCEDDVTQVTVRRPNLYFLVDVSGSMAEPLTATSSTSKIAASKQAILRVVKERGPRLNFGLAAFPFIRSGHPEDECNAGRQLLATTPGDPLECGKLQSNGPVLEQFSDRVLALRAGGGTPLSPSLAALAPELLTLDGQTALIVLTDGAPNCNPEADCPASECSLSLFYEQVGDVSCGPSVNCCDSSVVGDYIEDPGSYCFDGDESVRRVDDLREAGITTFIVGVPGASEFQNLMNDLAEAGGAPRSGNTKYFDVRDDDELDEALDEISAQVALPCELELEDASSGANLLNVYLDRVLLKAEPPNGWSYEEGKVTLLGESCERVQRGDVQEIAIVSGCGTILK